MLNFNAIVQNKNSLLRFNTLKTSLINNKNIIKKRQNKRTKYRKRLKCIAGKIVECGIRARTNAG